MTKACACVVGWHFQERFFEQITRRSDLDVYIVSHRSPDAVPPFVSAYVPARRIFFEPNIGYDWGAYQQFIEHNIYRDYSHVFLLHDDVVIHDPAWFDASIALLNEHAVVGNGTYPATAIDSSPWCYAATAWKPPSPRFRHDVVRGSFVATTSSVLARVQRLEVFWDWMHLSEGFGNWSLRATCGKLQSLFGERTFAFLGTEPTRSAYLTELVRGGRAMAADGPRPHGLAGALYDVRRKQRLKLHLLDAYQALCDRYMRYHFAGRSNLCRVLYPLVTAPARRVLPKVP